MKPVRIFDEALRDIDETVAFYEAKREGLGIDFFDDYWKPRLAKVRP